jgi:chaperonin GroES
MTCIAISECPPSAKKLSRIEISWSQEGTVIAVGSGRLLDNGDRSAMDVREGDRVLFAKYGGTEFKLDGEEYLVLKENDILAILG